MVAILSAIFVLEVGSALYATGGNYSMCNACITVLT